MVDKREVVIYTDGGCSGNPGPGGYGAVLHYNSHQKQLSGGFLLTTNNRMEIMAAIVSLEALKFTCRVTLYSDSRYLVDAMAEGEVRRWKANGWRRTKKEQAANTDLWDRLLALCDRHTVKFVWLKGHAGHQWNEVCDKLSKEAATRGNLISDDGYDAEHSTAVQLQLKVSSLQKIPPGDQLSISGAHIRETHRKAGTQNQKHPQNRDSLHQVQLDCISYTWDRGIWYDTKTTLRPPEALVHKLNALLMPFLEAEDKQIGESNELLQRAKQARDSKQYARAEKLARRVAKLFPDNVGAFAVLSSCLRARGCPQEALDETECAKFESYPPLLNSRAAALCDLGRWEEAKNVVGRSLAIGTDKGEAFLIVARIKATKPELYQQR